MWQTPRLSIREFRTDDWQDLHALQGDPEATKFVGGPWSPEKTREVTDRIVEAYPDKPLEWFAVADRSTDRVLGVCWLGQLSPKYCEALGWGPEIELGYRYARIGTGGTRPRPAMPCSAGDFENSGSRASWPSWMF